MFTKPTGGPVSFDGVCTLCGAKGRFEQLGHPGKVPRSFRCTGCQAALIFQAEAAVLLDEYSDGREFTLDELAKTPRFARLSVYFIGISGPVRTRLKRLEHYCESVYLPDQELGSPYGDGRATVQDHTALTFEDQSFDLLMSSHVLEHVPDPSAAFREAFRVLKPHGRYIFTVPLQRPIRASSTVRAELGPDGLIHHLPEQYHQAPEGSPALVFTQFGADLVDLVAEAGFMASIRRPHRSIDEAFLNYVVVATRPPEDPPPAC